MQDSIIVAVEALRNSQEFYSTAFEKIQTSYNIFIGACVGILTVVSIVVAVIALIANRENKNLKNTDKELKEKFNTQEKDLIVLFEKKQKELEMRFENKEAEFVNVCKSIGDSIKTLENEFKILFEFIRTNIDKDSKPK